MNSVDELTQKCKTALGDNLLTAVLYGSAAAGFQTLKFSDVNVLLVVRDSSFATLKALAPISRAWVRQGNPPPLIFSAERLRQAQDVFPIEFLDIKDHHRVLHGVDPFQELSVSHKHLRHQLEFELRGKLIQLRERYLALGGLARDLEPVMAKALSSLTVLFKGVLRLMNAPVSAGARQSVWKALNDHVAIDVPALEEVLSLREGKHADDPEALYARLVSSVENVIDFVDKHPAL